MNMYYGLSVMALRRNVSASDYSDHAIADPQILSFMPRIKIAVDSEIESKGPAFRHAARVAVQTTDGRSFRREVWHRRGSPENPVSRQEVEEKFAANVNQLLSANATERLKSLATRLDILPDAKEIIGIMASPIEQARSPMQKAVTLSQRVSGSSFGAPAANWQQIRSRQLDARLISSMRNSRALPSSRVSRSIS